MIVRDLRKQRHVMFTEIEIGEVFRYGKEIYLKTYGQYIDGISNAFSITHKQKAEFPRDVLVEHIPSELILHESGWEKEDE